MHLEMIPDRQFVIAVMIWKAPRESPWLKRINDTITPKTL